MANFNVPKGEQHINARRDIIQEVIDFPEIDPESFMLNVDESKKLKMLYVQHSEEKINNQKF